MIAVDTNILVYAHRSDSSFHDSARARVAELAEGVAPWAIPWPCLHEFLAIVTHPRRYAPPSSMEAAADQVAAWLESPGLVLLTESHQHFQALREAITAARVVGPRVHDARIVALCQTHGIDELWSVDRDFGRFPQLAVRNPLL